MAKPKGPKPNKPYKTFPLTAHAGGSWCKKVNGKLHYFGPWDDPEGARTRWEAEAPALRAGRRTVAASDAQTLRPLCGRWLVEKEKDAISSSITWGHYSQCCRYVAIVVKRLGGDTRIADLGPDHFRELGRALQGKYGAKALRRAARTIVGMFNFFADEDWIDRPVKLGKAFKSLRNWKDDAPPADGSRKPNDFMVIARAAEDRVRQLAGQGERDVHAARQLLAGIWLAVNGGYGSTDLATMPRDVVDLEGAVIDYRRGKTKKERIVPLMPETIAALRPVLDRDPTDELVFRTREGNIMCREVPKRDAAGDVVSTTTIDNFAQLYSKLLRRIKMKRPGRSFYELRHTHAELSDAAGDPHATSRIMGHALPGSKDPYIRVTPDRLRKVVDFIRSHLVTASAARRGRSSRSSGAAASAAAPPSESSTRARAPRSRSGESATSRPASSP